MTKHHTFNSSIFFFRSGNDFKRLFNLLMDIRTEMRTGFNRIRQEIKNRKRTVTKPDIFPMRTTQNIEEFKQCDDQLYTDVVSFQRMYYSNYISTVYPNNITSIFNIHIHKPFALFQFFKICFQTVDNLITVLYYLHLMFQII